MRKFGWRWLREGRFGRILVYGSSRSIVEALLGIRGVLLAGILGPEAFGIWALFRLTTIYGTFAGLGLLRGLELEVAKAWGDHQRRQAWGRTAVGCIIVIFGTMSGLALVGSLFVDQKWQRQLLLAVAAGFLLERLAAYGLTYMRASGSLSHFALMELVQSSAQVVATVALGYLFGLDGALFGFSIACLIGLCVLPGRVPIRPDLNLPRLKSMLAIGLPLSLNQLLAAMLATVDRLIVGAWLGLAALGQYAFAVSVASIGGAAALVVQTVVFPDMYRRLEREGAENITREHLERTIRPFVLILAPSVGAIAMVVGLAATLLLPRYLAAVQPAAIFVFTGIAQGVAGLAGMAVVAAGRQRFLPLFTVSALAVNALLATSTLALGFGMVGLAVGAVIARVCYAGGILMLVAGSATASPLTMAFKILWPILWCAGATSLIFSIVPPRDILSCGIALGSYLVAVSPVLVKLLRTLRPGFLAI